MADAIRKYFFIIKIAAKVHVEYFQAVLRRSLKKTADCVARLLAALGQRAKAHGTALRAASSTAGVNGI